MKAQDLSRYWQILKKRGWLPILLTVVTVGTMLALSLLAAPVYVASVRFQVTAPPPGEVSLFSVFGRPSLREEISYTRDNFASVVTSRDVAWDVIEDLQLDMTASELEELIAVDAVQDTDFTMITVSTNDPQLSADIANTLMKHGLAKYGEISAYGTTTSREFISSQLDTIGVQLEQSQQELIAFKIENKIGNLENLISSQQTLIRSLNLARDQALAEGQIEAAANYDEIIADRNLELQDLVQLNDEYSVLERKVLRLTQTYDFLLEKEMEAQLKENEALNLGFIQPLGEARVPGEPEPAIEFGILSLGAVLSLILGIAIVFLWEYFERTNQPTSSVSVAEGKIEFADAR
jgi:uncharacterized protein involved in exopolysaccharide biosynthesis